MNNTDFPGCSGNKCEYKEPVNIKYANTKTARNLKQALLDESAARNKYCFFASQARKDGFEQVAAIFEKTANNEKEHAKLWYKELYGIEGTLQNLENAAANESHECNDVYFRYALEAELEGFYELADLFRSVGRIEEEHEDVYRRLADNLRNDEAFKRMGIQVWECRNCGHIVVGASAPEECPVCKHPKAYFEIKSENF